MEHENNDYVENITTSKEKFSSPLGPLDSLLGERFDKYEKDFIIRVSSLNDRCFLSKTGDIVIAQNKVKNKDSAYFVGRSFLEKRPYFDNPLDSTLLDIFKVSGAGPIQHCPVSDVLRKCVLLPINPNELKLSFDKEYLAIPFLH